MPKVVTNVTIECEKNEITLIRDARGTFEANEMLILAGNGTAHVRVSVSTLVSLPIITSDPASYRMLMVFTKPPIDSEPVMIVPNNTLYEHEFITNGKGNKSRNSAIPLGVNPIHLECFVIIHGDRKICYATYTSTEKAASEQLSTVWMSDTPWKSMGLVALPTSSSFDMIIMRLV